MMNQTPFHVRPHEPTVATSARQQVVVNAGRMLNPVGSPQIRISANENALTAATFNRSASMKVHTTRSRNQSSDVVFKRNLPDISKFVKHAELVNTSSVPLSPAPAPVAVPVAVASVASSSTNNVNKIGSSSNLNSSQIRLNDFSTPTQLNENFLNSLNSNKLVKLNNSLKYKNTNSNMNSCDGNSDSGSLARSTLKTSSFHNYRRYSR